MLEGIVTWVLNNYVGEYLENLNADQLSIALLQGQVELENVPLKKTALRKFDIPLQVRSGIIGKLTLSIPITHMRSEPWILKMSDLLILLGPSDGVYDASDVEGYEFNKKEQLLEALENIHKQQLLINLGFPIKDDATQNQYWGASLVSAVSNNIQLILSNVHIRYEDDITMPDKTPFNFGVRIQHISIQTTNSQWKPEFVQPAEGVNTFKKLDIKGLSVFWNCHQQVLSQIDSYADLKNMMSPENTKDNQFILQPFSMQARMEKNSSKFPLKSVPAIPRFKFDLRPEKINIELSKKQLAQIRLLTREWARFDRARQHRKWRPLVPVKKNAATWWKFAINRVLEETHQNRKRCTLEFLLLRAKHLNGYCRAYRQKLEAYLADQTATPPSDSRRNSVGKRPSLTAAAVDDTAFMKQIEHDSQFTYHELHLFRETVFRRLMAQKNEDRRAKEKAAGLLTDGESTLETFELVSPDTEVKKGTPDEVDVNPNSAQNQGLYGWFASWFSSGANNEEQTDEDDVNEANFLQMWPNIQEKDLPPNLKRVEKRIEEEIMDVLNESWDDSTVLRRDNLLAEIVLRLERMIVRFVDEEANGSSRVIAMDMRQVASRLQLSPREHRTEISLSVGDMSVQRLRITPDVPENNADIESLSSEILEDEEESLVFGFGAMPKITPQLLFAIGRAREEGGDSGEVERMENLVIMTEGEQKSKKPLFQMIYRRMAPRLNVLHELDAKLAPVSIIYDEDAVDGIANLFDTESAIFEKKLQMADDDLMRLESVGETQCYLNFSIPSVLFELRSKRTSLAHNARGTISSPFACATVSNVDIGISKNEPLLTRLKISFSSLVIDDLYEKTSTMPLIRTVESTKSLSSTSSLSKSCPDLHEESQKFTTLSSSLPNKLEFKPVFNAQPQLPQPTLRSRFPKKNTTVVPVVDNDFGVHISDRPTLSFIFVDPKHQEYESKYSKRNCIVDADIAGIDVAMNRRSWTMLLDFFGALGAKPENLDIDPDEISMTSIDEKYMELLFGPGGKDIKSEPVGVSPTRPKPVKKKDYLLHLKFIISTGRVFMTYPKNQTQLGTLTLNSLALDIKVNLGNPREPMLMKILASELFIHDTTPFYSRFYSERLTFKSKAHGRPSESEDSRKIEIDVLKYRTNDPDLKRDCDMKLRISAPDSAHLYYIHTHRFFCGLLDFWFNFADLQDQVRRMNEQVDDCEDLQKMRTIVDLALPGGVSLILPLNQFSDQVIVLETSKVVVTNEFQLASQTPDLGHHCVENNSIGENYDCLLEKMQVECSTVSIHEGFRLSVDKDNEARSGFSEVAFPVKIGQGFFQNYFFAIEKDGILTRKYDLHIDVFKNLSSFISHNVPDLTILTKFDNVDLLFSTSFYCLLRGFLEKNLGEQLIPVPETVPIEVLQNPEKGFAVASVDKYLTLSFRLSFQNVQFHFRVPENPRFPRPGMFKKFGRMVLHKARISFDSYIDNISEFDLICESTELIDTRFEDLPKEATENAFPLILQPIQRQQTTDGPSLKLMSEAHIMMRKDEAPVVTLVLQNSRIVLILDWLNNAKDFFLLNTSFVPPEEPGAAKFGYGIPKEGIVTRLLDPKIPLIPQQLQTVTLKITLRDSDLILLEEPKDKSSLSLFCSTTAVLNLHDQHGVFEANLEIQKMCCAWCVLSSEEATKCQISNDFSATVSIRRDIKPLKQQTAELVTQTGVNSVDLGEKFLPKQKLNVEMSELVARVSYKDILVLQSVLKGSLSRLQSSFENSVIPKNSDVPGKPPFVIQRAFFSSDHLCFWFLDDSQGVALPVLRFILSDVYLEHIVNEHITSKLQIGIDYFNQRVFGWEPFIEPWKINEWTIRWKPNHLNMILRPNPESPLDFNITHTLVQQAKQFYSKWASVKKNLDRDFRNLCIRSRADHLPYLLKNETGTNLLFTTDVAEINRARADHRKPTAKWFSAAAGQSCTFEFPTKRLIASEKNNEPRRLIVRVDGWDEISPVDVDSVGTYFRVTRMTSTVLKKDAPRARVVVAVTMDQDGRKVVTIRSALLTVNELPDPILLKFSNKSVTHTQESTEIKLEAGGKLSVPLQFVNAEMEFLPCSPLTPVGSQNVDWRSAKIPGDVVNKMFKFRTNADSAYWACVSVKREHYPEYESLSGHTIVFVPPLTLLNLLPVEMELDIGGKMRYSVGAGGRLLIMGVDLSQAMLVSVRTEQFRSIRPIVIYQLTERESEDRQIEIPMVDRKMRPLDMYASVYVTRGGGLHLSIWVPYWIVNRSGIPLIIKQEATISEAAGQLQDHERAKDRNPLMFSFADENCPLQCAVRVGNKFERDPEYKPQFCKKFSLSSGVQAIKLLLTHEQQATLMYDVGVEVRQCTGRYKDTQVVLFTPRYRLNNQSSTELFVCHQEDIDRPNQHVPLASKCNLIWHENFEDKRRLCVRRSDVPHWSCPFRLDQIGSFHVTMRSRDETPQFVRVEVALSGASFWVTFTDAIYFPAPIKIRNLSNVPVLYQQASKEHNRFRTICKANSTVDYSWDDLYGEKLLTLQVYENKSHSYDPSKPKRGPPLTYDNYLYIQYAPSFVRSRERMDVRCEEHDLVLEVLVNGKVVLNSLNIADSSQRQLWKFAYDGSLENVGMNHTAKQGERFVLDVLEASGFALMVVNRTETRNNTQKWEFTNDGRFGCGLKGMYVENVGRSKVVLSKAKNEAPRNSSGIPVTQNFVMQYQKPGTGILDVECLHVGPTLVVQITEGMSSNRTANMLAYSSMNKSVSSRSRSRSPSRQTVLSQRISRDRQDSSSSLSSDIPWNIDAEIGMPAGIGMSLISSHNEELIYARFQGVQMHLCRIETTYQMTGHVNVIQVDNQILTTERWPVLYCQVNSLKDVDDEALLDPKNINVPMKPALKLEMNCTPKQHYDAFDCFRVKLCDMCVLLDETLLWKIFQFIQETDTADVVSQNSLIMPPNIEPDMNVPGTSDGTPTRRCYFGILDLEVGNVALTVITVAKNGLPKDLQLLKRQFNIKLVSFENALVTLPAFRQFHYFETLKFLIASLSKFYMMELQKQTMNIIFTMDAFGNPRGLATDLKESFQGLLFEADITGFVAGLGYGVTNSLSKVASSMSYGVGSLTFDEQHELMRRRLLKQPQSEGNAALSHLCNGVKGLGVGVFGGLTAIARNTSKATKTDGFLTGFVKGFATGAVDTVTKPVQGVFDLLEGTASAVKEVVGSQQLKKSRFPDQQMRLPRVCTNLQSLLPPYSVVLAEAQQELLRINGYTTTEMLLDVEVILKKKEHDSIEQRVLICSEQCYCLRQINDNPASVVQRIAYRYFKNISVDTATNVGPGLVCIAVTYDSNQRSMSSPRLVCGDLETARRLCEKVLRAKQLYDHSKRTLAVKEDFDVLQI